MPMVDITHDTSTVSSLNPQENRELNGVLKSKNAIGPQSRIGDNGTLQIQANIFQETSEETITQRDQTENV